MKMFWKASWVPEAAVRTTRSIGPLDRAPGTWLQLRTRPEKMSWTWVWLRVAIGLAGLRDHADRVAGEFVEDDAARIGRFRVARGHPERHAAARDVGDADVGAALQDHELDFALCLGCLTKAFASLVASGAIEVEPLIVIVAAEAEADCDQRHGEATQRRRSRGGVRFIGVALLGSNGSGTRPVSNPGGARKVNAT